METEKLPLLGFNVSPPVSRTDMLIPSRRRALALITFLTLLGISYLTLDLIVAEKLEYPINIPDVPLHEPQILLVSAFYPLAKAKHSRKEYARWMKLYLTKITTHIYFFAPPEMEEVVRKLRGPLPMTLNTSFASPFDIPPLKGLEGRYKKMNKVDPERAHHSPELYAVWSSKTYFLREALLNMQSAGMNIEYVFWNDAGSFREKQDFNRWPAFERIEEIFAAGVELSGVPKEELFFMPMWNISDDPLRDWTPLEGPKEYESAISEGSFFGGRPDIIHWWYKTYWAYHDYYIFKLDKFAGKDQVVFNGLFMVYPKRFITVWQYDRAYKLFKNSTESPLGECGEPWWYYQFFLASDEEREHMRRVWTPSYRTSPKFPDRPPAADGVESKACRVSRVLWMENVMRSNWGNGWRPPRTPVDIDASYRD